MVGTTRIATWNRPRIGAAVVALGCTVALSACGSSAKPTSASGPRANAGVKFAACMRSHGLANFPDPSAGGGIQLSSSSGLNPRSPAFQSAQSACSKLLPGGGPGGGPVPASRKAALVKLAQCMRKHGISAFPDPTASPPSPGAGGGVAFGSPGAFIAVPQSMMQSPGFNQAAAACSFPGAGRGLGVKNAPAS